MADDHMALWSAYQKQQVIDLAEQVNALVGDEGACVEVILSADVEGDAW